jgi:eukaryotic-like serine/threonine-protein kinase
MAAPFDPPLSPSELIAALPTYAAATVIFTGGQGAVFRATTPAGGTHALKIYFPDPDAPVDERTDREVAALRRLRADTLVSLEGDGHLELRGSPCRYVATSFIDGRSLASALRDTGPLPVGAVARIGADIADAIGLLWSERIVHRDVTPNNVMLRPNGHAVLIDLGLARHTALASLSGPHEAWGTPGYVSPEQHAAVRALTCKADVFSLGIVLQQALLGTHPCARDQRRLLRGGPATRSVVNVSLSPEFCRIVDEMVRYAAPRRPAPSAIRRTLQAFANP